MTLNVPDLKAKIDCRELIASYLGPAAHRYSTWHMWRCPFHEDHDPSFAVKPQWWKCFGCGMDGDCITWVRLQHDLSFVDACKLLGAADDPNFQRPPHKPINMPIRVALPPSEEWQLLAYQVVMKAMDRLWAPEGAPALKYLHDQRGLADETIRNARLGYVPGTHKEWIQWNGINIPCGITIPRFIDGDLWGVNVRRAYGKPKYQQIGTHDDYLEALGKGQASQAMYWADYLEPGRPALITEGEFDCLVAWQEAGQIVSPVTLGSATNSINPRWFAYLACNSQLLACYDTDEEGDKGAARLAGLGGRVQRIQTPVGKDVSEYHLTAGPGAVTRWLQGILPTPEPIQAEEKTQAVVEGPEIAEPSPVDSLAEPVLLPGVEVVPEAAAPKSTRQSLPQLRLVDAQAPQEDPRPEHPCPTCGSTNWILGPLTKTWLCGDCAEVRKQAVLDAMKLKQAERAQAAALASEWSNHADQPQ